MVTEIKSLDGDMKSLVYENYNKFISATDTIRKMKSNVENMESEMARLSKDMQQITDCSNKIEQALAPRQQKIEQLSGVHNLLQKLQFLVALPARLRQCVEMEQYDQAVKYFTITSGLLSQYHHLPSFHSIHQECERIISDMRTQLKEKIADPKTQPSEVSEVATYLIDLSEPIPSLRQLYLSSRKVGLENMLNSFEARENGPQLIPFVTELSQSFLIELMYTLQSYRSLFINRFDENKLDKKDKQESAKQLESFALDVFARFLNVGRNKLSVPGPATSQEKINALEVLTTEVMKVSSRIPEVSAADKVANVVNSTLLKQIAGYFTRIEETVAGQLQAVNKATTREEMTKQPVSQQITMFNQLCESTNTLVMKEIGELVEGLKTFFAKTDSNFLSSHYGIIFDNIEVKLQTFLLFLNIEMQKFADSWERKVEEKDKKNKSGKFILLLVNLCLYLERKGVSQVMNMAQDLLNVAKKAVGGPSSSDMQIKVLIAPELAQRSKECGQKLLARYVKVEGQKIGTLLRRGIEAMPSLVKKEPREPRLVVALVLNDISDISKELEAIFAYTSASSSSSNSQVLGKSSSVPSVPLFDKKVDVFGPLDFTPVSLLTGIVKIGLKGMLESVRLRTFGRNAYQQIQVDLYLVRTVLRPLLGSHSPVDQMLTEVEQSVAERCTDPTSMETSIIIRLCDEKVKQINASS
eukprot:TRINITY_DN5868_c0_g1_i1.p1 TRINITY_DN5868_c0_g1~~TRINITY_DN5868_c0_g1_i1.p1  ORF type:complete len:788 (+),score=222.09 TRINITY_DN5868_c0_g1_i1:274-2364(+)